MERRYFIIELLNTKSIHACKMSLGEVVSLRYNKDETKVFIKTTDNLIRDSKNTFKKIFPKGICIEYTLEEVTEIVNNWFDNSQV